MCYSTESSIYSIDKQTDEPMKTEQMVEANGQQQKTASKIDPVVLQIYIIPACATKIIFPALFYAPPTPIR
jgi:hypothetical protein